jgi:non-ribosomal peptide synthetase component E (peptide arylation enzyme)
MAKPTRYTPQLIEEYTRRGFWEDTTFSKICDQNARDFPNKEALVDSRTRLTWAQVKQQMDRLALKFLEMGFKRNEMIVIQLPNCVELWILRVACEKAGLLCLPVVRTLRHREMEHILSYTGAVGLVIPWQFRGFDYYEMIQELRPALPNLKHLFVAGDRVPEEAISLDKMLQEPLEEVYPLESLNGTRCPATEFSLVLLTTGSTGLPKFLENPICARLLYTRYLDRLCRFTSDDIFAAVVPGGGGSNMPIYFNAPLLAAKVVMLEHFDPEEALKLIERERATIIPVTPAVLAKLIRHPNFGHYNLSSVRLIYSTGAPLPYQMGMEAEEKLVCPVVQGYGAIDYGPLCLSSPDDSREVRFRTVGKPVIGNEIKLVDEAGTEVGSGEVGEVMARGATCVSGYYKDPEATRQAWTQDGWFGMGDLGKFDEHGNLMIVGRSKDIIIRGGQNIYPAEIEDMLMTHPHISEAAIVGIPDPIMGEKACAFVVPKPGQQLTFDGMVSFLQGKKIAAYKLPERLEVVERLPMLADGQKVDKRLLRQIITQDR